MTDKETTLRLPVAVTQTGRPDASSVLITDGRSQRPTETSHPQTGAPRHLAQSPRPATGLDRLTNAVGFLLTAAVTGLGSTAQVVGGLRAGLPWWQSGLIPAVTELSIAFLLLAWYVRACRSQPAGPLLFLAVCVTGYAVWLSYTHAANPRQGSITGGATALVFVLWVAKLWYAARDHVDDDEQPLREGLMSGVARWLLTPALAFRALMLRTQNSRRLAAARLYRVTYQTRRAAGDKPALARWHATVTTAPVEIANAMKALPSAPPSVTPVTETGRGNPDEPPLDQWEREMAVPEVTDRGDRRGPYPPVPISPAPAGAEKYDIPKLREQYKVQVAEIKDRIEGWQTRDRLPSCSEIKEITGISGRPTQQKIQAVFTADRADYEARRR